MKRRIRLIAHNIRSLWNVGSFFRTCDALGVEHLHLTGYTGHPPRKEITKTAIGAELEVPWDHRREPLELVRELKRDGWTMIALEIVDEAIDIEDVKSSDKICLIVGHELSGVPQELIAECDIVAMIPMHGKKESLNVAVAAGIALNRLRR